MTKTFKIARFNACFDILPPDQQAAICGMAEAFAFVQREKKDRPLTGESPVKHTPGSVSKERREERPPGSESGDTVNQGIGNR